MAQKDCLNVAILIPFFGESPTIPRITIDCIDHMNKSLKNLNFESASINQLIYRNQLTENISTPHLPILTSSGGDKLEDW